MDFVKSATRLRLLYEAQKDCKYTFQENGSSSSLLAMYEQGAIIGTWLVDNGYSNTTTSVIARSSTISYTTFVSFHQFPSTSLAIFWHIVGKYF